MIPFSSKGVRICMEICDFEKLVWCDMEMLMFVVCGVLDIMSNLIKFLDNRKVFI